MKQIGIIGAGRFGMSLAKSLAEAGVDVLLIERNGQLVQQASAYVSCALQGDAVNERMLEEAGISQCDVVVVAIGANVEASTLVTLNCKELGVKEVVSKATSELHGKILEKLGADLVIYPDRDSAHRLARQLTGHGAFDLLEVSEGFSVAEVDVPVFCVGKTLAEVDVRKEYGVTVLCIRRADEEHPRRPRAVLIPGANDAMIAGDKLLVFGSPQKIDEFSS